MVKDQVVIVGAGHAGSHASIALRQRGYTGTVLLLGDEPDAPYERPPLSKDYLAGERLEKALAIRSPDFWEAKGIILRRGKRAVAVDSSARIVQLGDGEEVSYSSLIWAAGGTPRRLSCEGADLPGIHVIRTRADVDRLRADLYRSRTVLIVGGGYIGLETAAILVQQGHKIVLVEAQDHLLARTASTELSKLLIDRHRSAGVDVRLGINVTAFSASAGRIAMAHLSDATDLSVDLVIVGIGIIPSVQVLSQAGATGTNGVDVDTECRTSLPDIWAIGDCAARVNPFARGQRVRLESVQNAMEHAVLTANAVTGQSPPAPTVPTFWSNQYEIKIQTAGLSFGYDEIEVRQPSGGHGIVFAYRRRGMVIAADCVNAPGEFMAIKRLIAENPRQQ